MNYKITCHLMPWELDRALLTFIQLGKSRLYLNTEDSIFIDVTLNLSSHIINWEKSSLSKEFFIEKYNNLKPLLKEYICKFNVYEGNKLYGALNTQLESTEDHIDFYSILNPDLYFSEYLLAYLIDASKQIKNSHWIITPQIVKQWDSTWDVLCHPHYVDIPYEDWREVNIFDVIHSQQNSTNEISLTRMDTFKWAGWWDFYSKDTWNDFCIRKEWEGYGPCDFYGMLLAGWTNQNLMEVVQYRLDNQVVCEYEKAPLGEDGLAKVYKNFLHINSIPNQKQAFMSKMQHYLSKGQQELTQRYVSPKDKQL